MRQDRLEKEPDYLANPDKKRNYNRNLFRVVAAKYNRITPLLSFGQDRIWKNNLISKLPDLQRGVILDLASGTGDLTFALAKKYPQSTIIGVDLTPEMVEIAKKDNRYFNVHFAIQDMGNIGIKDDSLDLVTGGYALRNSPNLDQTLIEIYRVLRPGGGAFFLDFAKSNHPILQKLHYVILKIWGSIWGVMYHGNASVYGYIADSLSLFPDRKSLNTKLLSHGFTKYQSQGTFLGFIQLIEFWK